MLPLSTCTNDLILPANAEFFTAGRIVVACSGGPDSMALVRRLATTCRKADWSKADLVRPSSSKVQAVIPLQSQYLAQLSAQNLAPRLTAVCYDHNLRPFTAIAVLRQLQQQAIPLVLLSNFEQPPRAGQMNWARQRRYAAISSWMQLNNRDILALAQHQDDQIETYILRKQRASTAWGLAAISGWRLFAGLVCWRPLLGIGKTAIFSYLRKHQWQFELDPTNSKTIFTRGKIRQALATATQATATQATALGKSGINKIRAASNKSQRPLPDQQQYLQALDQARQQRQRLSALVANWISEFVEFDTWGQAQIDTAGLHTVARLSRRYRCAPAYCRAVIMRAFHELIKVTGGTEYGPRWHRYLEFCAQKLHLTHDHIAQVTQVTRSGVPVCHEIGRVKITITADSWFLCRSLYPATSTLATTVPAANSLWDGRWRIRDCGQRRVMQQFYHESGRDAVMPTSAVDKTGKLTTNQHSDSAGAESDIPPELYIMDWRVVMLGQLFNCKQLRQLYSGSQTYFSGYRCLNRLGCLSLPAIVRRKPATDGFAETAKIYLGQQPYFYLGCPVPEFASDANRIYAQTGIRCQFWPRQQFGLGFADPDGATN